MQRCIHSAFTMAVICSVSGMLYADDLDAALQAQKKKAERRIYSQTATFHSLDELETPDLPTEEELALDEKLRKMDEELDRRALANRNTMPMQQHRRASLVSQPQNQNWLTPEMMKGEEPEEEEKDNWLLTELERQKEIKEQRLSVAEENARVDKILNQQRELQELNRLNAYEQLPGQQKITSFNSTLPSYEPPARSLSSDPLENRLLGRPRQEPNESLSLSPFSPQAIREAKTAEMDPNPFSVLQSPTPSRPKLPSTSTSSSSIIQPKRLTTTPSWNTPKKPLSPLEQIKKSSFPEDPFDDDALPGRRNSGW